MRSSTISVLESAYTTIWVRDEGVDVVLRFGMGFTGGVGIPRER